MNAEREELLGKLEAHYKGSGWSVKRSGDGTLQADGPGGVTWIGAALTSAELADKQIEQRLLEIARPAHAGRRRALPARHPARAGLRPGARVVARPPRARGAASHLGLPLAA